MAGQIRLTPEDMRTRSNEYTQQSETFQEVIQTMRRLLTQLQTEWEGASSQAFEQRFNELEPSFRATKDLIDEIAANLMSTANSLEQLDADIASKIGG
ncbi:WXG100 family type VII secretion target [Clostridium perfringens]|uniref:WXG100 family type VII secretion target n=1 Tax=Clostridium perfringens TaxID=1502 RepID=UPI002245146A|nr:WXG100 family type VII secretion target [Clostridium perfringens]MCX0355954.1 WXG100 family type VII secretion target [Clostridium perfringens]MDM0612516.1 WXG100 family type VII secretion target [Clostridium perfringens]